MKRERNEKMSRKAAISDDRRAKLAQELRANLLKRKAQAKARELPRDRDGGRQS
jgi:hypothetical protein